MAVITTNLGTVTAYGDAVAAGYTGTKEQWQALMADYATVGTKAAQDAQTASTAAQNASTAAQTATTKANEASQSAQAAQDAADSIGTPDTTLTIAGKAADAKATGDEISELKSGLNDKANAEDLDVIIDRTPVAETLTLVPNEYVNASGAFVAYNNWSRTDYIEVEPGATISFTTSYKLDYNFSYDANKRPIGSRWTVASGTSAKTLGDNVHYIALSGTTTAMTALKVYVGKENINLKSTLPLTAEMESQVDEKLMIPDQVAKPTAYLMKMQIPNYYFSRNETALTKHDIGYLDDKINSIPEGYHFMFVTDTHWNDNAQQSAKLISYVRDRIGAKIVLFGGDILTAHTTDAIAYRWMCDFIFEYKNMFGSNFLPVVGNHDLNAMGNSDSQLLYSDLVPVFTQGCDARFHYCDFYDARIDAMKTEKGMTDEQVARMKQYFRTCYYVDDVEGKARYIIYNTGAGEGGSGITEFIDPLITGSYEEMLVMEWVYNVLMHTPVGYNVILCTHIPGDFSWTTGGQGLLSAIRQKFATVVAGMKAKKNVTVYMPNAITDYSWWGGSTLTFNFTNAPDIGLLLVMGGHTHVDAFGKYGFISNAYTSSAISKGVQSDVNATDYTVKQSSTAYGDGTYIYEVPIILTQHDAYTKNSGPNSHTMELGTITEQVIDVVTITPSGDVALTRIGAGNDRYLTIE